MICPRCQHPLSAKRPTVDGWRCMAYVKSKRGGTSPKTCRCTKSPLKMRASLLRASVLVALTGLLDSTPDVIWVLRMP